MKRIRKRGERLKLNLYCVEDARGLRFATSSSMSLAALMLDGEAALPNEEQMQKFFQQEGLNELQTKEIQKKFGVVRNTVNNWRRRAGIDGRTSHKITHDRIKKALTGAKTVTEVMEESGSSYATVIKVAKEAGYVFGPGRGRKRPPDAEIIAMAPGKTLRELAKACGLSHGAMINYLHRNPDLREKVRSFLKKSPKGINAHGKLHVPTLIDMYKSGMSMTKIAETFEVNIVAVRYWLMKNGLMGATNE